MEMEKPLSEMSRDDLLAEGWRRDIDFSRMTRCDTPNLRILIEESRKQPDKECSDE